jgi:tetratricopeptide (TPR) repeat protein
VAVRLPLRHLAASSLVLAVHLSAANAGLAQDRFATARDLYHAASYDDALALLNNLHGAAPSAEDGPIIEQYRALCLLALGRPDDARRAMEDAVSMAPSYHPGAEDLPPAVRAAFRDVRRRVLPGIIQQRYADAKAAFDRKDAAAATIGFGQVLDLLGDADLAAAAGQPPLSNLRALATDFRNLSQAAAAPPPPPPAPAPPPPPPPVVAAKPEAPPVVAPAAEVRIYGPEDANVVPPLTVRQSLPPVSEVFAVRQGVVEIIIDRTGAVEAATMRVPVNPVYDRLVLSAARNWRYRAATLDGQPVRFRKIVQIDIKSR